MHVQLVLPQQLFEDHLAAPSSRRFVVVEDDLLFREFPFHQQKLVLHRASMRHFARRLQDAGFEVDYLETSATTASQQLLHDHLKKLGATDCTYFDVVDDWLSRRLHQTLGALGVHPTIKDTPGFILSAEQVRDYFKHHGWRMQHFYEWQRRRLGVLLDAGGDPAGGKWSFDTENRKKLPRGLELPELPSFPADGEVAEAIAWVQRNFPDNPGSAAGFDWPVTHEQASVALTAFLTDRFTSFGAYEDAIAAEHSFLFHSALSSSLNTGLLKPLEVLDIVLDYAGRHDVPIASVEGYVRQVIGWREYMRASYQLQGRRMRTSNSLGFDRSLPESWWTGQTGLEPVDVVIGRINATCYAHHIERLMVLGNAMLLLRIDPDSVYEWFMSMFIDAYDWVMVPNVYAMSQYAATNLITTKPYISGSNYLKKMSDFRTGPWADAWDGLYWEFVDHHRDLFARNPRSRMSLSTYDKFSSAKKDQLRRDAAAWLGGGDRHE